MAGFQHGIPHVIIKRSKIRPVSLVAINNDSITVRGSFTEGVTFDDTTCLSETSMLHTARFQTY
jgi:hypothetical protein